jgi:signal transduction histidine kinase
MQPGQHPDAIDTRLVLRIYRAILIAIGLAFVDGFPLFLVADRGAYDVPGVPWGRAGLMRIAAAAVASLGFTTIGLSRIDNPVSRRGALLWFATAHVVFGAIFLLAGGAIFDRFIPQTVLWTPLVIGIGLLYIGVTCAHAPRLHRPFQGLFDGNAPVPVLIDHARPGIALDALRSQYEQQIRQAARMEERARLARDLHDAVKQQLFAIQTSAATVQARFESDRDSARSALDQIRACARDAMTELEAMIEQLRATPIENAGLVSALRQQCEALEPRTGATVTIDAGVLPPSDALPPGAQQALFRAAQEALSNIVVQDVLMPGGLNGIDTTRRIVERAPAARVIALTASTDEARMMGMLRAGATGYLRKDADQALKRGLVSLDDLA